MSQGIIPELENSDTSYGRLRNRETARWYSDEMKKFLYSTFEDYNPLLTDREKKWYNLKYSINSLKRKIYRRMHG